MKAIPLVVKKFYHNVQIEASTVFGVKSELSVNDAVLTITHNIHRIIGSLEVKEIKNHVWN